MFLRHLAPVAAALIAEAAFHVNFAGQPVRLVPAPLFCCVVVRWNGDASGRQHVARFVALPFVGRAAAAFSRGLPER